MAAHQTMGDFWCTSLARRFPAFKLPLDFKLLPRLERVRRTPEEADWLAVEPMDLQLKLENVLHDSADESLDSHSDLGYNEFTDTSGLAGAIMFSAGLMPEGQL